MGEAFFLNGREYEEEAGCFAPGSEYCVRAIRSDCGERFIWRTLLAADGSRLIERERTMLTALAGRFLFSIPAPEYSNERGMLYPRLDGVSAIEVDDVGEPRWNVEGRSSLFVDSLASALVQIHSAERDEAVFASVDGYSEGEVGLEEAFLRLLDESGESIFPDEVDFWREWVGQTVWPDRRCLIHGDMHAGNILVDQAGRVTGLVDWTYAGWGSPCQDFIFHYFGFGQEGLRQLLESYERQGGSVYPGMAEHVAGLWAVYSLRAACLRRRGM